MWWWINPGGFWERWGDQSQERIIGNSALYNKRQQGIQWQINGPPRLLRHLLLYKAWSTGGPFTRIMWPLEAAASILWLRLIGQCQKKTHELKEEPRSGSGPRGATLHQSVNYQSWRLTQGKGEFQTRERPALEVHHTHACHPQHGFTETAPVWHQGLAGFLEREVCPSSHTHANKMMTATKK